MNCPICNAAMRPFYHAKLEKTYHACPRCDYIALDSAHYVSPEREKAQYDQHHNSLENTGYVEMFERFINFFMPYTHDPKTALDFGSGPGPVLAHLLNTRGIQTVLYDRYFAPDTRVFDQRYDLITATEVIEHLSRPMEVLTLLKNALVPEGILALMTQFHPQDDALFCNWWYPRDPTHIGFFTPKTFQVIAERLDLKLLKYDEKSMVVFQKEKSKNHLLRVDEMAQISSDTALVKNLMSGLEDLHKGDYTLV